jgi:glycine/D-amino acid oxidase-like deaminating enzyme
MPHIIVIGAGAFGGWTALELVRRGARVTLIDAWGPGNVRASSGGHTRVIRATYGSHAIYTAMAMRALDLWREHDAQWQTRFLHLTGALWMFGEDARFGVTSAAALRAHSVPIEEMTLTDARRRYPQFNFDGISSLFFEPQAGYLRARAACEHVAQRVEAEGGMYRQAAAIPPRISGAALSQLELADGSHLQGDAFVFACGPWLGSLLPDVIGSLVSPTRQEVYYYATPAGDSRFQPPSLPVWLDAGERFIYGIPERAERGFKIADDTPGQSIDPTSDERLPTTTGIAAARAFLAKRFPDLANAPLLSSEVCQYESTPDSNFILDRHPQASNVWIAGGGSGHGFKMGPVVGQMMASLVLGESEPDPAFALARFAAPPAGGWRPKWA